MKQGTILKAKSDFTMRQHGAKGRPVTVKTGDLFAVTSPEYQNKELVIIGRKANAKIGQGYAFSACLLAEYFEVTE